VRGGGRNWGWDKGGVVERRDGEGARGEVAHSQLSYP
jgi:hypothetical protein